MVAWAVELAWQDEAKASQMSAEALEDVLNSSGTGRLHLLGFFDPGESMCGPHRIGT